MTHSAHDAASGWFISRRRIWPARGPIWTRRWEWHAGCYSYASWEVLDERYGRAWTRKGARRASRRAEQRMRAER